VAPHPHVADALDFISIRQASKPGGEDLAADPLPLHDATIARLVDNEHDFLPMRPQ
jgi:hypothetical protein